MINARKLSTRFNIKKFFRENIKIFSSDFMKKKISTEELFKKIERNEINIL